MAGFLAFQVLYMAACLALKHFGHGQFTLRDGLSGIIAFVAAALAAGFFEAYAMSVSSGPRMTNGMLGLVVAVVYVGVQFVLKRLWK